MPRPAISSTAVFIFLLSTTAFPGFAQAIKSLELRDTYEIPNNFMYEGTQVGGLSGIDYDPSKDVYYLICDDRSALQPARYYTAQIRINKGIDTVVFIGKVDLLDKDGHTYPPAKANRSGTIDPEAIRYNMRTGEVIWLSEGERIVTAKDTILVDPAVNITKAGKAINTLPIPAELKMTARAYGARQNGTLEAVAFTDDFSTMWVAMEEPLFQDGPRADVNDSTAWVRFYQYDYKQKSLTHGYAYDLDPVAYKPILSTAFRVNGITDILSVDAHTLLAIERSFTTGRLPCTVKIFTVDTRGATDVKGTGALAGLTTLKVLSKKLLLNMDTLGVHVDNVEGITWGPTLPNGHRTLLLVTDNNFQSFQKTQIFLLEVFD